MQLGLFSISYAGLWGQTALNLHAFVRHAAELGFGTVMLAGKRPHLSPLDTTPEVLASLRQEMQSQGIRCPVIAAYLDLGATGAAEVPWLEMQLLYCESLCRMGAQLGAQIVRVFTAYESPGQDGNALWQRVVLALREMSLRAASHGLTVAIQNHHDLAVHTSALLELLQDIDQPNCKLGFDAWSPALRGENLHEAARLAAPHTVLTTNADYVRLPRYHYQPGYINYLPMRPDLVRAVPFGTGFIEYPAFFEGLRAGGFEGLAIYEMCSPIRGGGSLENLDRYARTYRRWMEEQGLASGAASSGG